MRTLEELLNILVCPIAKTPLKYNEATNELFNDDSGFAYPIKNGIPIMLTSEARNFLQNT